jgi:putative membrane protein
MSLALNALVLLVAVEHLYIMALEMFLWDKPPGLRAFRLSPEFAAATRTLAANQGLYNGFLAAGLVWGLLAAAPGRWTIQAFFLGCVGVAGVFGAVTARAPRILLVQALPAGAGLLLLWLSAR